MAFLGREQTIKLKTAVEVGKTMPVLVPVGMPRWQALTHLEQLRSLQKIGISPCGYGAPERFLDLEPHRKAVSSPCRTIAASFPVKNESKKSELLPPFK